jgi:hypothetical protein
MGAKNWQLLQPTFALRARVGSLRRDDMSSLARKPEVCYSDHTGDSIAFVVFFDNERISIELPVPELKAYNFTGSC